MKLVMITSLKENQADISRIFKEARIDVFSASEIIGFKESNAADIFGGWFGNSAGSYDSVMLFSITEDDKALSAMQMIGEFNKSSHTEFPIRGFILPVEHTSY